MSKSITLYYANWCGHCHSFKPEWEKLKLELNKHNIKYNEYEHSINSKEIKKAHVVGFPTIRIKIGKNEFDYEGERTTDAIMSTLSNGMRGGGEDNINRKKKKKEKREEILYFFFFYKKFFKKKKKKLIISPFFSLFFFFGQIYKPPPPSHAVR